MAKFKIVRVYEPRYSSGDLRWHPKGICFAAPYLSLFEERYGRKTNQGGCGPRWIPGVMFWAILTCFVRTFSQRCI